MIYSVRQETGGLYRKMSALRWAVLSRSLRMDSLQTYKKKRATSLKDSEKHKQMGIETGGDKGICLPYGSLPVL